MEKEILKLYLQKRDLMEDYERNIILEAIKYICTTIITGTDKVDMALFEKPLKIEFGTLHETGLKIEDNEVLKAIKLLEKKGKIRDGKIIV